MIRKQGYPSQTKTFDTEAEAWATVTESEMVRGVWRGRSEAEHTTLHDTLTRYGTEIVPSKKGAPQESYRVKDWQARPIARMFMAAIRPKDVTQVIKDMEKEGKAGRTIKLHLSLLSHRFNVSRVDWGMDSLVNPVELVRKPKGSKSRDRRLQSGEESRLLAEAEDYGGPIVAAIIRFALETGTRRSEIAGLPRRIDGEVWGMMPSSITQAFVRCCERAGITPATRHCRC